MTEVPEHLLKRSQAARARAAGRPVDDAETDTVPPRIPYHMLERSQAARARYEQAEQDEPKTLVDAIADIYAQFGVTVVPVPEGMPADDARGILDAFASMGDMSPEFIERFGGIVQRVIAQAAENLHVLDGAHNGWAAPTSLISPASTHTPVIEGAE
ncbi:MAG: hypothetical protein KIH63_003245 [Candidatus Saccharibacteria bacterium]|nr:hypothetical protein [Candidatus Saccharibacteria bacterium]